MHFSRLAPVLLALVLGAAGLAAFAADPPVNPSDEQALKAAGLKANGPALLEFLRKRSAGQADADEVADLIKTLGNKDPILRDKAMGELVSLGQAVVPALRQAANELDNAEAAAQARKCLGQIEGPTGAALTAAAVRALGGLKPPGTVEALVAYLPQADDDLVLEEITAALVAVAVKDGKADPGLVKALTDAVPVRRSVAAEVLAQVGGDEQRPAVRRLLKDPKPTVRLRTALALAQYQDPEAVPVLIGLLAEAPPAQARQIEEFLAGLAGDWAISVPAGNDAVARKLRRDLWGAWWSAADGPALIDELKKRTPSDADREKVLALIAKLGDKEAAVRDKAMADLVTLGAEAAPLLRQTQANAEHDAKLAEAAQKCLSQIDPESAPPLPAVAARLLALRRPAGAAEAVLAYLPSAEDDQSAGELRAALTALAVKDGKADAAVVKALEDKSALRRAAAAEALAFAGATDQRDAVRKLLKDQDQNVRLRVALALTSTQDKESIPPLIAMITELPPTQAGQAEYQLRLLAGEGAPEASAGDDAASRKKTRDAWEAWWKKNGDKLQLAKLDSRQQLLGYTIVVDMYDNTKRGGRVVELDRHGKVRWEWTGVGNPGPLSAQMLPGDRVLISEHNMGRVVERDLKGKELWSYSINQPMMAQRLSNGNTFMVGRGQVIEVDKAGKEILNINRMNFWDVMSAARMKNGEVVYITQQGQVTRMDKEGKKEIKHFQAGQGGMYHFGYCDLLQNEHVVLPNFSFNKVTEYDANGKEVWSASVTQPICAKRLPNGNTLVTSLNPSKVVELNRAGKVVWEAKETFRQPFRVDRR
jgi:HEAT repeat protein